MLSHIYKNQVYTVFICRVAQIKHIFFSMWAPLTLTKNIVNNIIAGEEPTVTKLVM